MSPSQQRTLIRFVALLLASGAGDALIQFATSDAYDYRHLVGLLVASIVMALEKLLSEQNSMIAAPTVGAVNTTLQSALESPLVEVPPPTVRVQEPPTIITLSDPPENH
jgi:hypothetical protein